MTCLINMRFILPQVKYLIRDIKVKTVTSKTKLEMTALQ